MMQKNLTCKTLRDAQKNVMTSSFFFVLVNILFMSLGAALIYYAQEFKQYSLDEIKAMRPEEKKNLIVQTANELLQSNLDEEDRQTVSALANMSDETINSLSDEDIMEIINGLLESK